MDDIYKNIEDYNLDRKRMIVDIISNKKLNPIVTELFTEERKLNISSVFIAQMYQKSD